MNIGQRIKEVREDLGMQSSVLARRVGVAANTIYRIEAGDRTPSVALLEKIARELRTEPAELLRELGEPVGVGKAEASKTGPETVTGSMHAEVDEETFKALVWALTGQILDDLEDEAYQEATGKVRKMRELLFAS